MLDTIAILQYPDQTALVEMHTVPGDFGYCSEADARLDFYNFQGYPSLFLDGVDLWPISTWRPSLMSRMATPSPITLTITGSYDPGSNSGTVNASFRNDSSGTISGRVYFVITEDSLYHVDPNGHAWHNHLARDYLPDQTGETTSINAGQTVTRTRTFTINSGWDENRCYIVTWIQANAPSRNVYQAGEIEIMNLVGIEENRETRVLAPSVTLVTNPCPSDRVRFALNLPAHSEYSIRFYDITGQHVHTVQGTSAAGRENIVCDLNQGITHRINAGVYLYRFMSKELNTTGKIVIK